MNCGIETCQKTMACGNGNDQGSNINPFSLIDLGRVWFTKHALDQFHDRYGRKVSRGFTPLELLSWAEEDWAISPEWEKKRFGRHHDEHARYFALEQWRFVIVENDGVLSVITFEEKYTPPNPRKRRSRRPKGRKRRKNRHDTMFW